ncbi:hypothetical protein ATE49_04720 [Elizabethkingia miricola]|uniref:Phage tail collar domain-containing protein n=1 Tax=Elizabethkingia miricola TaxID=172045 RepID=A0ABY3NG86_ELIMR|nr:hypothetical protein [Elizabethkingia miricola]OBS12530.1 hypothetical protein ATE49_04720 [Elizabethkingia miricola]TYO91995.1 hypothetical protein LX74_02246 [Elizabethkingia miricola]
MRTFNYNQTGGFKVTTETLADITPAYSIVEGVARMAGNKAIISGCVETNAGAVISDGIVMINGELLEFKGGAKQNTVIIREIITQKKFENGEMKDVIIDRFATFGFSQDSLPWTDFKRIPALNTLEGKFKTIDDFINSVPLQQIEARLTKLERASKPIIDGNAPVLFMRPANEIPEGWEEATEFRGRFPLGLDPNDLDFKQVLQAGGNKTHTLTMSEIPSHRFSLFGGDGMNTSTIANNPNATAAGKGDSPNDNEDWNYTITSTSGEPFAGKTNALGGDQAHDIMNPYRVVIFIRFKG